MREPFYALSAKNLSGEFVSMSQYAGRVVLIVNTASKCGFTPQYKGLEALYRKYKDDGLVILGFPCNQFAGQEPGDEQTIASTCLINYGVTFPMFSKIDVNGSTAHPIFKYVKRSLGGIFGGAVKWNFTKFLLDKNGRPIKRFAPTTRPEKIEAHIVRLLKQQ
ncbi:MAG: glutathione peroxidase, partial [Deltaproteobacteria bacterium]|nr:glutathione peroxidase [Deltaproteobacteria bacterium]